MSRSSRAGRWVSLQQPLFAAASAVTLATIAGVSMAGSALMSATPAPKVKPAASPSPNNNGNGVGHGYGNDKKIIVLSGEVVGLYPGATKTLTLTASNQNNFTVRLYQLTASVGTPVTTGGTTPKTNCEGSALVVTPQSLPVNIPQDGGTVTASVHMLPSATNDCRNATFPIRFTGKVDKP